MVSTRSQGAQSNKSDMQPPTKRVRMANSDVEVAKQPAGEPGLRERLLSLPVELFGEVCSYLDAIDLRHLSFTDETFWSVLVSAKSDPIWRQAFKQTVPSMPECPETMSGSSYARFMLAECCMICQVKTWRLSVDYFHRVRYCDACYQSNIISKNAVLKLYPDFPPKFFKYLSSDAVGSSGASLGSVHSAKRKNQPKYLKATVAGVYELWESLSKTPSSPELANARLIERLENYANNRIKSGLTMRHWQLVASNRKSAQLAKIRNQRRAMIFAKLSELGYNHRDFPGWHSEVYSPVALTEEGS
ncbi:hypothetical protein M407DRAFT_17943 [Tulasnella calospora MUT 4182]|uniref:F-box domain-containing protein n=1 Tax=Tulasnella calospora MUT 4182 TaxID=1051891 RepID=A0A0C3QW63_9AGAM|nr:hypothetical protein M407DRAFT_17943 [Tulasnella calospora MUT 4182]